MIFLLFFFDPKDWGKCWFTEENWMINWPKGLVALLLNKLDDSVLFSADKAYGANWQQDGLPLSTHLALEAGCLQCLECVLYRVQLATGRWIKLCFIAGSGTIAMGGPSVSVSYYWMINYPITQWLKTVTIISYNSLGCLGSADPFFCSLWCQLGYLFFFNFFFST